MTGIAAVAWLLIGSLPVVGYSLLRVGRSTGVMSAWLSGVALALYGFVAGTALGQPEPTGAHEASEAFVLAFYFLLGASGPMVTTLASLLCLAMPGLRTHARPLGVAVTGSAEWATLHRVQLEQNWANTSSLCSRWAMDTLPHVVVAEYDGDFRLRLTFADGLHGTVDFRPWLDGPVFEPLLRTDYFQRFFIDGGTVGWPNGADIAPETLYEAALSTKAA